MHRPKVGSGSPVLQPSIAELLSALGCSNYADRGQDFPIRRPVREYQVPVCHPQVGCVPPRRIGGRGSRAGRGCVEAADFAFWRGSRIAKAAAADSVYAAQTESRSTPALARTLSRSEWTSVLVGNPKPRVG
jgi:hypothetical protein